jgi:YVTN family beta-propeller protein
MLALTANGEILLVVNPVSNSVTLIDTVSLATFSEIPDGKDPRAIAISSEIRLRYQSQGGSNSFFSSADAVLPIISSSNFYLDSRVHTHVLQPARVGFCTRIGCDLK